MKALSCRFVDPWFTDIKKGYVILNGSTVIGVTRREPNVDSVTEVDDVVAPGYVDAHVHVESSGLAPWSYAGMVSELGVTSVVWDPHEVVNVAGDKGLRWALRCAELVEPFNMYVALPSCVPALGEPYETSGGEVDESTVERYAAHPKVVALGEVMDVGSVLEGSKEDVINVAMRYNLTVDGHAPGLVGVEAAFYFSKGPETDHEASTPEEFETRRELGVWIFVREGSSSRDLETAVGVLEDLVGVCLVTDDLHASDHGERGLAYMADRLIEAGFDPLDVMKTVTLNPSLCYGLRDGRLIPGAPANLVLLPDDLSTFEPERVLLGGRNRENVSFERPEAELPGPRPVAEVPHAPEGEFLVRCVRVSEGTIRTEEVIREVRIERGRVIEEDVAFLVVMDRYGEGHASLAFVDGFEFLDCGIVTTVAHDSHNVVAASRDLRMIERCVDMVRERGGCQGVITPEGEEVYARLDVAGLMYSGDRNDFIEAYESVLRTVWEWSGVDWNPFDVLTFVTLPVIPELRVTDRGLVRVDPRGEVRFVDVFVS